MKPYFTKYILFFVKSLLKSCILKKSVPDANFQPLLLTVNQLILRGLIAAQLQLKSFDDLIVHSIIFRRTTFSQSKVVFKGQKETKLSEDILWQIKTRMPQLDWKTWTFFRSQISYFPAGPHLKAQLGRFPSKSGRWKTIYGLFQCALLTGC